MVSGLFSITCNAPTLIWVEGGFIPWMAYIKLLSKTFWFCGQCDNSNYARPCIDKVQHTCTMVTVKIKGTACCLYNVYTSHGITSLALAVIQQLGSYTMWEYKVLVYTVQEEEVWNDHVLGWKCCVITFILYIENFDGDFCGWSLRIPK